MTPMIPLMNRTRAINKMKVTRMIICSNKLLKWLPKKNKPSRFTVIIFRRLSSAKPSRSLKIFINNVVKLRLLRKRCCKKTFLCKIISSAKLFHGSSRFNSCMDFKPIMCRLLTRTTKMS